MDLTCRTYDQQPQYDQEQQLTYNSLPRRRNYYRDLTCRTTINNLNMTRNNSLLITHYLGGGMTIEILPVELRSTTSI